LRKVTGVSGLWIKDETRSPTGSNKDRATALVLQHVMTVGMTTVSCSSTGNVAVSLAVGAAAAGKWAVVFVGADVAKPKLAVMLCAGATILKVKEGYGAAFQLSRQAAQAFGWYDRNTGVNPLTLEAKKTVALEIWDQLGGDVPDVVVVPVGDGVTLSALAKGFREIVACGGARRTPRLVGVQAEGCQPLKKAWETRSQVEPVQPATIADGIAVGAPASGAMALRAVRQCGGGFVAVSDEEIIGAVRTLARSAGVLAEPAAAAALAGLERAIGDGLIDRAERVVSVITGSALKTPQFLKPSTSASEVHADLGEVERALRDG
jgi:threonine synthase